MKVIIFTISLLILSSCAGEKPNNLGVKVHTIQGLDKKMLAPCGERSNCITSYGMGSSKNSVHPPIKLRGDFDQEWQRLIEIVKNDSSAQIIIQRPVYLYAEYKSSLFGFIDDVEFYYDGEVIQYRSASRLGKSDLGVNLKRINAIQFKFIQR